MAVMLNTSKLDYIDDRTKMIIGGYVRNLQQLMTDSSFKHIPPEMAQQILLYIDDYFIMSRGSHIWNITNPQLIKNILSSQPSQFFRSDIFEISKFQWIIQIYPNGSSTANTGQFDLFVHLLSMPSVFDNILVNLNIICQQCKTKFSQILRYRAPSSTAWGWPHTTLLLNDITNIKPESLTFSVSIKILNIITKKEIIGRKPASPKLLKYQSPVNNYRKKYDFRWIVDKDNITPRMFSDNVGEMFCAYYEPGKHVVVLRLCGFPDFEQCGGYCTSLQVRWTLRIIEADIKFTTIGILKWGYMYYDKLTTDSKIFMPSFERDDYEEHLHFTFVINVEILNEYDFKGNIIGSKQQRQIEWDKFINSNTKVTKKNVVAVKTNEAVLTASKLDYIDDRTKLIINGFVRNFCKSMFVSEIVTLILLYVECHFMLYYGFYEWKITDAQTIQNILSAKTEQCFTSDVFNTCKLKWMIKLYPNGTKAANAGKVQLRVKLLSMPSEWSFIHVAQTLQCKECNDARFTYIFKYSSGVSFGWNADTLLLNDVVALKPESLTFRVVQKIIQIESKKEIIGRDKKIPKTLKYHSPVNNYRKNYHFKFITYKNNFLQCVFTDVMSDLFCVFYSAERKKAILRLCGIPNYEQIGGYCHALQVKWTLHVQEADLTYSIVDMLAIKVDSKLFLSSFAMTDYEYDTFTFVIDVEILNEYDKEGNIIGLDDQNEWENFIVANTKAIQNTKLEQKKDNKLKKIEGTSEKKQEVSKIGRKAKVVKPIIKKDHIENLQMKQFRLWLLNDVILGNYFDILVENGFDNMDAIKTIDDRVLMEIGVNKVGHRRQMMKCVGDLQPVSMEIKKCIVEMKKEILGMKILLEKINDDKWKRKVNDNKTDKNLIYFIFMLQLIVVLFAIISRMY